MWRRRRAVGRMEGADGWGNYNSGNSSSASGASTTGDDESLMEVTARTLGETEGRGEWGKVTKLSGRYRGRKARELWQGGAQSAVRRRRWRRRGLLECAGRQRLR